jgi:hypothetical protein
MTTPLPPVPNVLKAVVEGVTSFAKNWVTIFHFLYSGGAPSIAILEAFATGIGTEYALNFMPLAPPSTVMSGCELTDLSSDAMPSVFVANTTAGTSTADKLPANCATLISSHIARRYRGGHPRNYLYIGTDENLLNESEWNPSFVTTVNNAFSVFMGALLGSTSGGTTLTEHVNVSYFGGAPTVGGVSQRRAVPVVDNILTTNTSPMVASQRRRLGR